MEYVEAFKDIKHINAIKKYLKNHSDRDYVLFVLGINTGLKIGQMLQLKVSDVLDKENQIKSYCLLPPTDDSRDRQIYLNAKTRTALKHYISSTGLTADDFLFLSAKTKQPISRQQAHRIIHQAVDALGIEGKYGATSMRKTFGYHAYKKGVSISLIQKHFHHATPSETMKYLGISKEDSNTPIIDVNL
ncbi:tyrosine-type recombinase/integrase [Bacillus sp. T33-2]|uniref:tyrosine-type recombinase/integrase n=1 Tax=Bacillus sp. T33-2 TaxID=2054168 RepID=UPI000C761C24|nr:tyrosine-type recombinase/integrase [Bacillus sp. T33-2]PLR96882.1 site-specific integrase [Bacillus sp. T33-2]